MTNILVVDKDIAVLQSVQQKLPSLNSELSVIPVRNVKDAIRNLDTENIDLVITELELPEINGFELLAYINKNFSYLPVIVMADTEPTELDLFLEDKAIFQYLPKPLDFNALISKISAGLASKVDQNLREVFLPSFLRLVSQQKKSYTLIIRAKNQTGFLHFNNGELFDAETGNYTNVEAALEILSWNAVEIVIDFETIKGEKKISLELEEIIFQKPKINDPVEEPVKQAVNHKNVISHSEKKENRMNIKKIQAGIKNVQEDLGDGLLATDFWTVADGQSLAGFNPQPKAVALFNKITDGLGKTLKQAGFPGLGRYYLIELEDGKYVVVLPLGKYQWGMLVDGQKVQLGMLLNIAIPHVFEAFEAAMKE